MSVMFATTSDALHTMGVNIPVSAGTIWFWVKPTWAQTDSADHDFLDLTFTGTPFLRMEKYLDNHLYCGWNNISDTRVALASGSYTLNQNQWNLFMLDWTNATSTDLFLGNATAIGSNAGASTFTTLGATLTLGNVLSKTVNAACKMAGVGFASKVLSTAERSNLLLGILPSSGVINYFPLLNSLNDTVGGVTLIANGTSFDTDTPTVLIPAIGGAGLGEEGMSGIIGG